MKKVSFCTLGCKVNAYDSACMQAMFENKGFVPVEFGQPADIVVVNTCTVTAVADKKSRAMVRRAAKTGRVIVAGCLAQHGAAQLLEISGVDAVIGTDDRAGIVDIAERLLHGEVRIDATHSLNGCGYEAMRVPGTGQRTRGTVKIQEGCDNFCSYCIIPYVRGRSRSRDFNDIMDEAKRLADGGVRELVITGIHIASYANGGRGLADVIAAMDDLPGIRVRLGSIEPGMLGEAFVRRAAAAKNLCPHFHLSLQSGSAGVLQRMNRKYTPEEYTAFLSLLRSAFDNPAITTDIIAGFPGETDAEHEETMRFVENAAFARIHVFPFSARQGTRAYDMTPKVPKNIIKTRAAQLIRMGDDLERAYLARLVGRSEEVLFEEASETFAGCLEGYSRRYVRVAAAAQQGEMRGITIEAIRDKTAYGQ